MRRRIFGCPFSPAKTTQFTRTLLVNLNSYFHFFLEKSSPSEVLHLCGKDGHVTVHSAVMSSELMGTAPTDLPYILRVESRQRCWPVQNLYLMAPSFAVKQKWVTSLEFLLDEIKKKNDKGDDQVMSPRNKCLRNFLLEGRFFRLLATRNVERKTFPMRS